MVDFLDVTFDLFKSVGFDIEIITNLKVVDFLDVTFDLNSSTYKPFRKPSDKLLYIHKDSSHPPNILKQLPSMIAERLSRNSSTKEIFDKHKGEYEDALNKAGHKAKLLYVPKGGPKTTKTRKRNITWFNPPYSKGVTTNVAKKFLELLDKHFPPHNKLHQIFNRNTVKVSYSCTSNVGQAIKSHNKRVTQPNKTVIDPCNCRNKDECPLDGKCRVSNAIYKCVVSAENTPAKCYIGLASGEWKSRYANHKKSFNHRTYSKDTRLSQYVWSLKDKNIQSPTIRWSIIKTAPPYSNTSKKCPLYFTYFVFNSCSQVLASSGYSRSQPYPFSFSSMPPCKNCPLIFLLAHDLLMSLWVYPFSYSGHH